MRASAVERAGRTVAALLVAACNRGASAPDPGDAPSGGRVVLSGADGVYTVAADGDTLLRVADAAAVARTCSSGTKTG